MVSLTPHAFSINTQSTTGSQLSQRELHAITKENDTKKKAKLWVYLLPSGFFFSFLFLKSKQDFDVCESDPAQGAEAWLEVWGPMNRSTTVACCVCLPFCPAAWTVEMGEHLSWPRRKRRHGHTHTHTHCRACQESCKGNSPCKWVLRGKYCRHMIVAELVLLKTMWIGPQQQN